jgi:proline dehydrogenase
MRGADVGLLDQALATVLPAFPKRLVRLVAQRYVAGARLDDALRTVTALNAEGACATVDVLGEDVTVRADAERTRDAYVELLRAIASRGLDSNVSVKLSAFGLKFDPALCRELVASTCEEARAHGNFVRVDMEDSSVTQATLDIVRGLRREHGNVGPVLQAYLHRTPSDARALAAEGANVRLCKGIYVEPRAIAWKDRELVRRNYAWSLRLLLEGGAARVGVATHDEHLVWEALRLVSDLRVDRDRYEFQMLLGVQDDLRRWLISSGERVRVYVPYGERWYEYSMRRLKENPAIAGHVARATVLRVFG